MVGPEKSPQLLSSKIQILIDEVEHADYEFALFKFYGGPRDYLVPTPSVIEDRGVVYVTPEINNLFMSLDHNSLLYSL